MHLKEEPVADHERDDHAVHLPSPTIWPFVMAGAITLMAAAFVLGVFVLIAGVLLFALSVWGWVQDLLGPDTETVADEDASLVRETERGGDD